MKYLLYILAAVFSVQANGQHPDFGGKPFIQNIKFSQYFSGRQNWCVIQNRQGIVYLANQNGVLEYDGQTWDLIHLKDNISPLWLDIDSSNVIYVAATNEFGILKPDSAGELTYQSLRPFIPEKYLDFSEVWEVRVCGPAVYFRSFKYLFRWMDGKITVFERPAGVDRFDVISIVNGEPVFRISSQGLYTIKEDSLHFLQGSEPVANFKINGFLPMEDGKMMVVSRNDGLFIYDGKSTRPILSKDSEFLKKSHIYDAGKIGSDQFVFVTFFSGVLIVNSKGEVCNIFNETNGLTDNYGLFNFLDRENGLWIGHQNGISRIFFGMPFRVYDKTSGFSGNIKKSIPFKGKLVTVTSDGLYLLDETNTKTADLFPMAVNISGKPRIFNDLREFNNELFVSSSTGGFVWNGKELKPVSEKDLDIFEPVPGQPTLMIYNNRFYGPGLLEKSAAGWSDKGLISTFKHSMSGIAGFDGKLWIGTKFSGLFAVENGWNGTTAEQAWKSAHHFTPEDGLPDFRLVLPFTVGNELIAGTMKGIYRWNGTRFEPYEELNRLLPEEMRVIDRFDLDGNNCLWIKTGDGRRYESIVVNMNENQKFQTITIPFINPYDKNYNQVFSDVNQTTWIILDEYILKYKSETINPGNFSFHALIREVTINGSTVIAGRYFNGKKPVLDHGDFFLRFLFTSPVYNQKSAVFYRVSLTKSETPNWSDWTTEQSKDYTNLREGNYTFSVQARDPQGNLSDPATFSFQINPPWYRSLVAYFSYVILVVLGVILYVFFRTRQLKEQNRQLEQLVAEKTTQLIQTEKMAAMGELTAGLSHEVNNPLTIIQLNAEMVQLELESAGVLPVGERSNSLSRGLKSIFEGVRRIRIIVEKMAAFSTSEEFDRAFPAGEQLQSILEIVKSRHPEVKFQLESTLSDDQIIKGPKIKIILYNILNNAAEAINEAQKEGLLVNREGKVVFKAGISSEGFLVFEIRDNGTGIPKPLIPRVFEPFYTTKQTGQGTGLGMYETYNMVKQLGGTITLNSIHKEETTVTVSIPV
ncbi:MAG: hypothetical protein J0L62_06595 [Bacteroidetes bacterium]|nr:hypothetical protein [Bacteroidota bacterium]